MATLQDAGLLTRCPSCRRNGLSLNSAPSTVTTQVREESVNRQCEAMHSREPATVASATAPNWGVRSGLSRYWANGTGASSSVQGCSLVATTAYVPHQQTKKTQWMLLKTLTF